MTKLEIDKPKFGELTQIASDLYWVHFELPFRLNHVNLFLMDTPKGLLILDAGLKSEHSEEHWEALINGPLKSKKFDERGAKPLSPAFFRPGEFGTKAEQTISG